MHACTSTLLTPAQAALVPACATACSNDKLDRVAQRVEMYAPRPRHTPHHWPPQESRHIVSHRRSAQEFSLTYDASDPYPDVINMSAPGSAVANHKDGRHMGCRTTEGRRGEVR